MSAGSFVYAYRVRRRSRQEPPSISASAAKPHSATSTKWTTRSDDVTPPTRDIQRLVATGHLCAAADKLPAERPYQLLDEIRIAVGAF